MSFKINFEPLNDQEIEKVKLEHLTEYGFYKWAVKKFEKKVNAKSGNTTVNVLFTYWDKDNIEKNVYDTFVFTRKMMWKIKHYCEATGQMEAYEKGEFNDSVFTNREGIFELGFEGERIDKETGRIYPPRNVVLDYVKDAVLTTAAVEEFNDDISF